MIIGVFAMAMTVFLAGDTIVGAMQALGVLIAGALYIILTGGMMYLGIGIYHNTKRMADAVDRPLRR